MTNAEILRLWIVSKSRAEGLSVLFIHLHCIGDRKFALISVLCTNQIKTIGCPIFPAYRSVYLEQQQWY